MKNYLNKRNLLFIILNLITLAMAYPPLNNLLSSAARREYYSHIPLIPIISIFFLYQQRQGIVLSQEYDWRPGVFLLALSSVLYLLGMSREKILSLNDFSAILTIASLIFWVGAFLFCYGRRAFRRALFPILFLLFVVPIPEKLMDGIIYYLQVGSTEFTHLLFLLTGIPFIREEFVFQLPGMSIEVAKQCSGIRSTLALVITSLIAGELFLKTGWKKLILVLSVFPITVFKNGLRIAVLSLLGVYVDPRILGSELHRSGGIPFFGLALLFMAPILFYLMKTEKKK
ncbi:MAG: exosortase/archaeosortase family protein [bacterium]